LYTQTVSIKKRRKKTPLLSKLDISKYDLSFMKSSFIN
jgi:hypothetical protein